MPSNQTTSSNAGSRDLHAVTKARYQKEMREELLSKGEGVLIGVTACLNNLEMSGILRAVREISEILLKVREVSGRKSCQGKVAKNCSLLVAYLRQYVDIYEHPVSTLC